MVCGCRVGRVAEPTRRSVSEVPAAHPALDRGEGSAKERAREPPAPREEPLPGAVPGQSPAASGTDASHASVPPCVGDIGALKCLTVESLGSAASITVEAAERLRSPKALSKHGGAGCRPKSAERRTTRSSSWDRFQGPEERVPAIGGCAGIEAPHSQWLLPPEVVLFEPAVADVFRGGESSRPGHRQIFLNTPLLEKETAALLELHKALGDAAEHEDAFPEYVGVHALRILQHCNFSAAKAVGIMELCLKERVQRLPVREVDVLTDLRSGFMYWHGRDKRCRPCLVIRLERVGPLAKDRDRLARLVIFVLEYALRFAMVPGRVENWVVLLDLANALSLASPLQLASVVATACSIAAALETVYCGRLGWMKIVNMPGHGILGRIVNAAVPAEKKDKVSFPQDLEAGLAREFEPNQLERRYGGGAPDVAPNDVYPFHFFPNACGAVGGNGSDSTNTSLHKYATRAFHEGSLWDGSSARSRERWVAHAQTSSLTPAAAEALGAVAGMHQIQPCRDVARWRELMAPPSARKPSSRRSVRGHKPNKGPVNSCSTSK